MTRLVVLGVFCAILLCSVEAALPTGAALVTLAKQTFTGLDFDHDGLMTHAEWGMFTTAADANSDGCLTVSEFQIISAAPLEMASAIFSVVDKDHDDCITTSQLDREFNIMDRDGDGTVTSSEFEGFYVKLFTQIELIATVG